MKKSEERNRGWGDILKISVVDRYLKVGLLLLAIASCAFGAFRGEMLSVLQKAAAICLECCGIG